MIPSVVIIAYSPNTFVSVIGFFVMMLPFFWVIRQGYLHTRHLAPYYVLDASRDRFYFNAASAKRVAVGLFPIAIYQGVRDDNIVDPFGAAFLLIVLSGFFGHFYWKWHARRQARKKSL